jgi:catechol 2,3-dioxygenase-like lactoylglutathione lyase family enzyme
MEASHAAPRATSVAESWPAMIAIGAGASSAAARASFSCLDSDSGRNAAVWFILSERIASFSTQPGFILPKDKLRHYCASDPHECRRLLKLTAPFGHWEEEMSETVNVRYIVDDVEAAFAWYTKHLGFSPLTNYAPAFADVQRGALRLLLSGPRSSAGQPMPDGERPRPGGWNRIHLIVDDLPAEVARLRAAGVQFRNDIVTGPGGSQVLLVDPSGNLVELFQPARG